MSVSDVSAIRRGCPVAVHTLLKVYYKERGFIIKNINLANITNLTPKSTASASLAA
jgi:hypothetical protein